MKKKQMKLREKIVGENILFYFEISFYKDNRLIFMTDIGNTNFLTKIIIYRKSLVVN